MTEWFATQRDLGDKLSKKTQWKVVRWLFGALVVIIALGVIFGESPEDEPKGDLNGTQAERAEALVCRSTA